MIVTTDLVDNAKNIHPPYKWVVGHRLALLALNKTYHKKLEEKSRLRICVTVCVTDGLLDRPPG